MLYGHQPVQVPQYQLLSRALPGLQGMVTRCAWCGRSVWMRTLQVGPGLVHHILPARASLWRRWTWRFRSWKQ